MGYTPAFEGGYHGTLCGKWPEAALWFSLFPLVNRNGEIDMTFEAIHALTGWPIDLLREGMAQLCDVDPGSRTAEEEGRRLVLIDPEHRPWGWRMVNHEKYREKARKAAQQAAATESGRDAERKRKERAADVQPRPALSGDVRLSDAEADSDISKTIGPPEFLDLQSRFPKRVGAQRWPVALRCCLRLVASGVPWTTLLEAADRYRLFMAAVGKAGTEYVQQAATFYGTGAGWREPWDLAALPAKVNGQRRAPPTAEELSAGRAEAERVERERIAAEVREGRWSVPERSEG